MEQTRFDLFKSQAQANIDAYHEKKSTKDTFALIKELDLITQLQYKMSGWTLIALFGDQFGEHLWVKFTQDHHGNLLNWLGSLSSEYRLFILHELKNDPYLFCH